MKRLMFIAIILAATIVHGAGPTKGTRRKNSGICAYCLKYEGATECTCGPRCRCAKQNCFCCEEGCSCCEKKENVKKERPQKPDAERKAIGVGEEFVVKLPANPSTGYSWDVKRMPKKLELIDKEFEQEEPIMPGKGGMQVLTFKALEPGRATLELQYKRPWEKDKEPAEVKRYLVTIKK